MSVPNLDELIVPGRTIVFCDDTEIAGQPVPSLVADLRLIVAIEMRSDLYAPAADRVMERLVKLGMPRFHATEIASPPSASKWSKVSIEERVEALELLADVLSSCKVRTFHVRVSAEEYVTLRAKAQLDGKVGVGIKGGLRRVFIRCLANRLRNGGRPAAVVLDREKAVETAYVEKWPEASFLIWGGPLVAPSSLVPGLQLADLAAWAINRMLVRRSRFNDGSATAFDKVALQVVAGMEKVLNLLDETDGGVQEAAAL